MRRKQLLETNRKGVSIVVGYVIFIVIAIALSGLVYNYVYLSIPKERAMCEQDVSLSIQKLSCDSDTINLELKNTGFFKIDAAYIRLIDSSGKIVSLESTNSHGALFFLNPPAEPGLFPSESITKLYNLPEEIDSSDLSIEIQPAMLSSKNKLISCEQVIKAEFNC